MPLVRPNPIKKKPNLVRIFPRGWGEGFSGEFPGKEAYVAYRKERNSAGLGPSNTEWNDAFLELKRVRKRIRAERRAKHEEHLAKIRFAKK